MNGYKIANFNWGRLRKPVESPSNKEFVQEIERINNLADMSKGFIWRFVTDGDSSLSFAFRGDPQLVVNFSIWNSINDLYNFSYSGEHLKVFKKRREWFEPDAYPSLVLWWVPDGHIPTIQEAEERLKHLELHGPTGYAFTFKEAFDPPL